MTLRSLLLSSDEKIVRALRRTLGDLDIAVEHCANSEVALRHLTRDRFEAIIVDCGDEGAEAVLRSSRSAPCNKRAVAVAILDPGIRIRSAFELGAHFILYKPVSVERARSSFRAARALMKKERRRNSRVAVRIPLEMVSRDSSARLKVTTTDLGEGGLAVALPRRTKSQGRWQLSFTLPGSKTTLQIGAEFAWQGTDGQIGLRFVDVSSSDAANLSEWLSRNSPDFEKDDPPIRGQLTDLTLGGCYLETPSPFPASTRVTLSMSTAGIEVKTGGMVRVMHSDHGMGVEFTQTPDHHAKIEKFLTALSNNRGAVPELLVEPEGLDSDPTPALQTASRSLQSSEVLGEKHEDALLALFQTQAALPADQFLEELRKQRGLAAEPAVPA